jgi:hypothetical protein
VGVTKDFGNVFGNIGQTSQAGKMRRFPPPWTIAEANDACFIVRDSTGQALGYFYFEEEFGRRLAGCPL